MLNEIDRFGGSSKKKFYEYGYVSTNYIKAKNIYIKPLFKHHVVSY